MSRQMRLCCFKSSFWQATEQYHTILQREHRNNDDFDDDDVVVAVVIVPSLVLFPSVRQTLQNEFSRNGRELPS